MVENEEAVGDDTADLSKVDHWATQEWFNAMKEWRAELPGGGPKAEMHSPGPVMISIVGPGGTPGTVYLVRGFRREDREASELPQTPEEWRKLGWEVAADGARSRHPKPNRRTKLAKASLALARVCKGSPDYVRLPAQRLADLLRACPDPATQQQRELVAEIEQNIADLRGAAIARQVVASEERREARRKAKLFAEEVVKVLPKPTPAKAAEVEAAEESAEPLLPIDAAAQEADWDRWAARRAAKWKRDEPLPTRKIGGTLHARVSDCREWKVRAKGRATK